MTAHNGTVACTPAPEAGELMWLMSQLGATPSCCAYCASGPVGQYSSLPGTLSQHLSVTCVLHHDLGAEDLCLPILLNCDSIWWQVCVRSSKTSTQRCVAIDASWSCSPALLELPDPLVETDTPSPNASMTHFRSSSHILTSAQTMFMPPRALPLSSSLMGPNAMRC